jgi:hypothetical protein
MPELTGSLASGFVAGWIVRNVRPGPSLDEAGVAISDLVQQCLVAAQFFGIAVTDIEAATGREVSDLIQAAFLARWNPEAHSRHWS